LLFQSKVSSCFKLYIKLELETWSVSTVDTSGLPEQYVEVIGPHFIGKQLTDIVHPQVEF